MASGPPDSSRDESVAPARHVLHVADYDIFDRFGRMLRHLLLAQSTEGLRVSLLTDDPVAVADLEGMPVGSHWLRVLSGGLARRRVRQLAQRIDPRPDVVHVWGTACLGSVGPWALRDKIPLLVHVLSTRDAALVLRGRWRERVQVVAGCRGLREQLAAQLPISRQRAEGFAPALLMPDAVQEKPLPAEHTLGVLWSGRLTPDAGLDTLVEAVATLRRKACDLQVVLVGAGPAVAAVRAHIRAVKVQDCVSLVEEPDLWDSAMSGADVCVVPARQEELFLAPLLAMAMGKVVVASRDQLAEWFVEDQTVWQFTPGSAVELAYHLSRVAANDRHAAALRQSAVAYVREHHAISRLVANLSAVYEHLAAKRNGQ